MNKILIFFLEIISRLLLGKGIDKKFPFLVSFYRKVFSLAAKEKIALVDTSLGFKLFVSRKDAGVGMFLRLKKEFEPLQTKIFLNSLKSGAVILDIGANIGYYTILASKKIGKRGKVFAFEPDPRSLQILKRNVDLNKCKNVTIVNSAVGKKNSFATFTLDSTNPGESSLLKNKNGKKIKVKTTTIDSFVKKHRIKKIDILKMDIEGTEIYALKGGEKTFKDSKNIKLFLECNRKSLSDFSFSEIDLIKTLDRLGFIPVYILNEFKKMKIKFSQKNLDHALKHVSYVGLVAEK